MTASTLTRLLARALEVVGDAAWFGAEPARERTCASMASELTSSTAMPPFVSPRSVSSPAVVQPMMSTPTLARAVLSASPSACSGEANKKPKLGFTGPSAARAISTATAAAAAVSERCEVPLALIVVMLSRHHYSAGCGAPRLTATRERGKVAGMGRTLCAAVGLFGLVACAGRSRTADADGYGEGEPTSSLGGAGANQGNVASAASGGGVQNLSGAPTSGGAAALTGFTGNEVVIDSGEPQDDVGLGAGSAFFWMYGLGNWFVVTPPPNSTEMDAPIIDLVPSHGDSTRAYRASGGGEPGVDLFAQLHHPQNTAQDLSAFYGIGFSARLSGADENLVVALGNGDSRPLTDLGAVPNVSLVATSDWQVFEIPFAAFGTDAKKVASIDFIVGQTGGLFDLWVNDLTLLCRGSCPTQ